MAAAQFADVQYQLERLYRTKGYIADLSFKYDAFMGLLKKRAKKGATVGGQADMVPVQFDGAGVVSNTTGIMGTGAPSQGQQFAVTPVQLSNLAQLNVLAAAAGVSSIGAIVKPLKHEIDSAIRKVGKSASIQLWSSGFPFYGQVSAPGASTTLTLVDPDDVIKFSVGDILMFAPDPSTSAARAGTLTVLNVHGNAGTLTMSANVNTVTSIATNDYIFITNTRQTGASPSAIGITGVQGWLPATAGTLFGVNQALDDRLIGMVATGALADIESAFIDGIAQVLTYSANGAEDITAFMHPKMWAYLAKAMQAKTVAVITAQPMSKKGRDGSVSFSGFKVATPSGVIDVFTPQFCPKNKIFMLNMTTWELVGWGVEFPSIIANPVGAAPPIFMDPTTGTISCAVGGFPQLECDAPGFNLTITLS